MNFFDSSIIHFLNKFSHHSWVFDTIMSFFTNNNLPKGGIFTIVLWWLWFKNDVRQSDVRKRIITIIISCFAAILLAKTLSLLLPYRARPLHQDALNFIFPYGIDAHALDGLSSFPSDHAVLFFTLSTGFLFISKKLGLLAFIYTTVFIAFPRVYLGLHFPTDIIAGALIGLAIAWLMNLDFICNKISKPFLTWIEKSPSLFYSLFFLITYQITDLFDQSRNFASLCIKLLKHII